MPALEALPQSSSAVRLHRGIVLARLNDEAQARAELRGGGPGPARHAVRRACGRLPPSALRARAAALRPRASRSPRRSPRSPRSQFARRRSRGGRSRRALRYGTALQQGRPAGVGEADLRRRPAARADRSRRRSPPPPSRASTRTAGSSPSAPRPADAPLPARSDRALPPRPAAALDRRRRRRPRQLRRARALGPETRLGREAKRFPRPSLRHGSKLRKDEPNGLWRPSVASGTLPPPQRTLTPSDAAVR